jgi:hypothetical protein
MAVGHQFVSRLDRKRNASRARQSGSRRTSRPTAWEEGGFWRIDFSDIHYPKHSDYFVPPTRAPEACGRCGKRGFRGRMRWNADESDVIVTSTGSTGRGRKDDDDDDD